jgi:hypothetical protein
VRLTASDRFLWVWLSRLWREWRSALLIVKPETVIAWHRRGFRLYWSWKSRHPQGRPSVSREVIDLIRKMSQANPRWGAPRIHGELLKLGFELSEATVAKYIDGGGKKLGHFGGASGATVAVDIWNMEARVTSAGADSRVKSGRALIL